MPVYRTEFSGNAFPCFEFVFIEPGLKSFIKFPPGDGPFCTHFFCRIPYYRFAVGVLWFCFYKGKLFNSVGFKLNRLYSNVFRVDEVVKSFCSLSNRAGYLS